MDSVEIFDKKKVPEIANEVAQLIADEIDDAERVIVTPYVMNLGKAKAPRPKQQCFVMGQAVFGPKVFKDIEEGIHDYKYITIAIKKKTP